MRASPTEHCRSVEDISVVEVVVVISMVREAIEKLCVCATEIFNKKYGQYNYKSPELTFHSQNLKIPPCLSGCEQSGGHISCNF